MDGLLVKVLVLAYDGTVTILALWRVSHMIANEKGPWYCFRRLRLLAAFVCQGPENKEDRTWLNKACRDFHLHDMLECEYCNSLWLAPLFMLAFVYGGHVSIVIFTWLALSTTTIFLKRIHEKLER